MYKPFIIALFVAGQVFGAGLKPSFDLGFAWTNVKVSQEGYEDSDDFMAIKLMTTLPYSRIIGLQIGLASYNFYDGGNTMNFGGGGFSSILGPSLFSSQIGLIEYMPASPIALFFKEYVMIERMESDMGYSMTNVNFGMGIGTEFPSNSKIRAIFELQVNAGRMKEEGEYYDYTMNLTSFGFGLGVRFGL